ncbi:hypothetical protein RMATCC62417_10878 [Rhizopus microsporus]|nr:hypothetical protein RMATCC62417_10878 [Rhizopus microsporus]
MNVELDLAVYLVLFLVMFGFIVFVLLFGESPSLRNGPIGKLHFILTEKIPKMIT